MGFHRHSQIYIFRDSINVTTITLQNRTVEGGSGRLGGGQQLNKHMWLPGGSTWQGDLHTGKRHGRVGLAPDEIEVRLSGARHGLKERCPSHGSVPETTEPEKIAKKK